MELEKVVYETILRLKDKDNLCLITDVMTELHLTKDNDKDLLKAIAYLEHKKLIKKTALNDILVL